MTVETAHKYPEPEGPYAGLMMNAFRSQSPTASSKKSKDPLAQADIVIKENRERIRETLRSSTLRIKKSAMSRDSSSIERDKSLVTQEQEQID